MKQSIRRLGAAMSLALLVHTADAASVRVQNANYDAVGQKIIVKGVLDAIPAGTRVDLVQVSNNRVLGSDGDGNKQFLFQVPIAAGQAIPCHLKVQAGSSDAYVQVRHSSTCSQQLLTLSGLVTDAPIPFAVVTVSVGGVSYTTIADEFGRYTLDIATASITELVTIESVKKMASGETIDFVSLAGSFSKLLADANGGVLSDSTSQKVNVTNVSTAEYVLLVEANGGTPPTTVEELQQAETQIDATELLQLAAVIKLIVDGTSDGTQYDLPPEYPTLLEFLKAPGAADAYIASQVDPADLNEAIVAIVTDNNLVAGFTIDEIPSRYFVTSAVEPGFLPRSGEVLDFATSRPNGCAQASDGCTGTRLSRDQQGTPLARAFNWHLQNGVLETNYVTLQTTDVFEEADRFKINNPTAKTTDEQPFANCQTTDLVNYRYTELGASLARYSDGQALDSLSQRNRISYSNFAPVRCYVGNDPQGNPLYESRTIVDLVGFVVSSVTARDSGAIAPRRFVRAAAATGAADEVVADGTWALSVYSPLRQRNPFTGIVAVNRSLFSDVVTLNTGGSVSTAIGPEYSVGGLDLPSTWSIDPATGDLLVVYGDGWTQRVIVTDSLDVNGDGGADEFVAFNLFQGPGGQRYGTSELAFKRAASIVADETLVNNPLGKFWQTVVNAWVPSVWEDDPDAAGERRLRTSAYFGWRAAPVGQGFQGFYEGAANPQTGCLGQPSWFRRPFVSYEFEFPGTLNLVAMDYQRNQNLSFGQRSRIWSIYSTMNIDGQRRLYMLEIEKFPNATGEPHSFPPRPNAYREYTEPTIDRGLCEPTDGFKPSS